MWDHMWEMDLGISSDNLTPLSKLYNKRKRERNTKNLLNVVDCMLFLETITTTTLTNNTSGGWQFLGVSLERERESVSIIVSNLMAKEIQVGTPGGLYVL